MLQAAVLKRKYYYLGSVFSKRQLVVSLIIFAFSLVARYQEYYTFRELTSDKSRQLHVAYQLLNGKGATFESYNLNTFQPELKPVVEWPPLYPYLIAAISYVSGSDIYSSSVALDFICITALWLVLFWFTRLLNFSLFQQGLLFILLAFAKTLFIKLYSADLLATTLFLAASALTLFVVQKKKKRLPFYFLLLVPVAIFLMVFHKYSLLPASFAIGLSLVTYAYFSEKRFRKPGLYFIAACVVSVGILILYNQILSGESTGISNRHPHTDSMFHFGNLKLFDPFIINAFFFLDVLNTRFSYYPVQYSAVALSAIIFIWISATIIRKIKKGEADFFSHLVLVTSLCIIGFLTALSIYYPKDAYGSYEWTYVNEFRYFAPAVFLIVLFLIKNIRLNQPKISAPFAVSAFVIVSIFCTFLLGTYYRLTENKAGSFENMYGKIVRVNEFVERNKNEQTYFISLSNHAPTDSETTSLVATNGTRVAMSYYGYFPESNISLLFSKNKQVPAGKKLIVFLDQNVKVLDSINLTNRHTIEQNNYGEKFLVINN